MTRRLVQQERGEYHNQIRAWGLSGFIGHLVVVEREYQTGNRQDGHFVDGQLVEGAFKRSSETAAGVLASVHRTDRNATSEGETQLIFQGGGAFTFRASDLFIITDVEDPS